MVNCGEVGVKGQGSGRCYENASISHSKLRNMGMGYLYFFSIFHDFLFGCVDKIYML